MVYKNQYDFKDLTCPDDPYPDIKRGKIVINPFFP